MMFYDVCVECINNKDFVEHFNRLMGHKLRVRSSPIVMEIDKACGYDPDMEAMPDFISFVFNYVWLPLIKECGHD
jgi:TRAP-type C4-dicarboxylate transport system substrate-binding protein